AVSRAGFVSAALLWVLARGVVGFFVVSALAVVLGAALAVDFVVGFAAFASAFAGVFGAAAVASLAANAASSAACFAAASSSFMRSLLASASALRTLAAALLPSSFTSVIRRIISSWRWPFLTRRRAFGRYLNEVTVSPRSCRQTSASTAAPATTGRPIVDSSPSATSRTRSSVMLSPGAGARRQTCSALP